MTRTIPSEALQEFADKVLIRMGTPESTADVVAAALVRADLQGHDSHGVMRLPRYVEKIRAGTLQPDATPLLKSRSGAIAVVDGQDGFGQLAARFAVETVNRLAEEHGAGVAALQRTQHIGRLADYAESISAAGLIALILTAGAGPGGSVAPFGGRERRFGTNPLAWGLPVPKGRGPLVADFSTAAWPEGKVAVALSRGESVPNGVLIDRHGRPSNDPSALYDGGALLPFGGAKGSSLMFFIEAAASILGGSAPACSPELRPGNPTLMFALKVEAFLPFAEYQRHLDGLLRSIESCPPAEGFERVFLPNAIELATADRRRREGIPVPSTVWTELVRLGEESGVSLRP